jgi:hypothetical protein
MRGNDNAAGVRKPRVYQEGPPDQVRAEAYQGLDAAAIRRVAVAYWGELAEFAYWCYDVLNGPCFGGRVRHPLFQFCRVMPYGSCVGQAQTAYLDRPVIDVFLSLWTRRPRRRHVEVFATVAHEMMHFDADRRWKEAGGGRYATSHDNQFWFSGVEALSPALSVDLGMMKPPYEYWPGAGWSEGQKDRLEKMLATRQSPAEASR